MDLSLQSKANHRCSRNFENFKYSLLKTIYREKCLTKQKQIQLQPSNWNNCKLKYFYSEICLLIQSLPLIHVFQRSLQEGVYCMHFLLRTKEKVTVVRLFKNIFVELFYKVSLHDVGYAQRRNNLSPLKYKTSIRAQ